MLGQEKGPVGGGILADQMGLGKTIQAISLIIEDRDRRMKQTGSSSNSSSSDNSSTGTWSPTDRGPTLVVCPTSALLQWKDEIENFVANTYVDAHAAGAATGGGRGRRKSGPGAAAAAAAVVNSASANSASGNSVLTDPQFEQVRVLIFYGNRGAVSPAVLRTYDIVLTTYPILEYEYRRLYDAAKVACQYCGKKYVIFDIYLNTMSDSYSFYSSPPLDY